MHLLLSKHEKGCALYYPFILIIGMLQNGVFPQSSENILDGKGVMQVLLHGGGGGHCQLKSKILKPLHAMK